MESSSPPTSAVSTASHYSFSSPSHSPSPSSSTFSTVHVACEQWRVAHHRPPRFPPPATTLPLPLPLLHSPLFTLHVNSGEQLTTGLYRFHRQPLLFLFSFVFCILHCSHEPWRMHPLFMAGSGSAQT